MNGLSPLAGGENAINRSVFNTYPRETTLQLNGIDEQINFLSGHIPGLSSQQARAIVEQGLSRESSIVFGGSRLRGNFGPASDLDVGFGNLSVKQAERIVDKINKSNFQQGVGLKLEDGIAIVPGKSTPNVPKIISPEEFFQRSGVRSKFDPKAGQPYVPSGSVTVFPNGQVRILPPGSKP